MKFGHGLNHLEVGSVLGFIGCQRDFPAEPFKLGQWSNAAVGFLFFFGGGSQPPKMARKMPPKAQKKPMDLFKNVGTDIPLFYSCWSNPWFMYWGYKETLPTKVLTIPPPAPKEKRKVGPSKLWKRNSGNHTILGKLV